MLPYFQDGSWSTSERLVMDMSKNASLRRLGSRIVMMVAALLIMFIAAPALPSPAYAESEDHISLFNNKDEGYSFDFNFWFGTANTRWRNKDNNTSVYLRVDHADKNAMRLYVDGATSSSGANYQNLTDGKNKWVASPSIRGEYEIHNSVNETGRGWARLGASSDYGPAILSGVWSPDCVGRFPALNKY